MLNDECSSSTSVFYKPTFYEQKIRFLFLFFFLVFFCETMFSTTISFDFTSICLFEYTCLCLVDECMISCYWASNCLYRVLVCGCVFAQF